jgi:hypothetical protein
VSVTPSPLFSLLTTTVALLMLSELVASLFPPLDASAETVATATVTELFFSNTFFRWSNNSISERPSNQTIYSITYIHTILILVIRFIIDRNDHEKL